MLVQKTDSQLAQTDVSIEAIEPFAPIVRRRASRLGFRPVSLSDLGALNTFYERLDEPLGDLNGLVIVAWRRVLDLHLLIEDEILYLIGNWEGGPMLWGPPLGERVSINHVQRAFELLHKIDPPNLEPVISFLWTGYTLWTDLVQSTHFVVVREGTEYIYDTNRIAALAGVAYKKKRKDYFRFKKTYYPIVVNYSEELANDCLRVLSKWLDHKSRKVVPQDLEKLRAEYKACENALQDRIPLSGVVGLVDGKVRAFSVGGPHAQHSFNCMFEKTDPDFPQVSAFIFCELAQRVISQYSEITLGEDWHVGYLTHSKQLWKPVREQPSYYLQEVQ